MGRKRIQFYGVINCNCGCGQEIRTPDNHSRPVRYVKGHNTYTKEFKLRLSFLYAKPYLPNKVLCECKCGGIVNTPDKHARKIRFIQGHHSRLLSYKENMKRRLSGVNNPRYNPNFHLGEVLRKTMKYINWRKDILKRNNYTCQKCNKRGGVLHVDHIRPFSTFPKLRLDPDNARVLCKPCHLNTESYGRRYEYAQI